MTSDLDMPLLPSAEQIRRREFATIRRGYDPDQVRDYLQQVAEQVETLEHEIRDRKMATETETGPVAASTASTEAAASDEDAYEALAKRFSGLIETADKEASRILEEAKAEADRLLDQARSEADRIQVDAQARAEEARHQGTEALGKAREEADHILSTLTQRRESLVRQMHEMRTRLLAVAEDLETEMDEASASDSAAGGPVETALRPGGDRDDDDIVDPRYEDLWVSSPEDPSSVDIPDLASIDLDVDDDARD
jgi:DivIVA domain-containing protein